MTEQIAALDALIEAVTAGEPGWNRFATKAEDAMPLKAAALSASAYCGSLDAAKALHEALLPGWEWGVTLNADEPTPAAYVAKWGAPEGSMGDGFEAQADNAARAWLLATLKAYRAGL